MTNPTASEETAKQFLDNVEILKSLVCPRACDKDSIIIIAVTGQVVIQCVSCQLNTPVLPLAQAIDWWRTLR